MLGQFDWTSWLIVAAVGTYVFGFLFRNQIHLRLLVVLGSCFYILYYATVGPSPLWDAILGSTMIALASLQGVVTLWWSKQPAAVPKPMRHIYSVIGQIEPGLFRRLIRAADLMSPQETTVLVHEGQPIDELWFLVDGTAKIMRKGLEPGLLEGPGFIGEIGWLSGTPASATVVIEPGAELVHWRAADLRRAARRSERLELALEALIAQDLARKLARSHPIGAASLKAVET